MSIKKSTQKGCLILVVIVVIIAIIITISNVDEESAKNEESAMRVLSTDNVNTRTGPGTNFEKAKKYAQYGDRLHVLKDTAGWIKYTLGEGSNWSGWVKKEFTTPLEDWKDEEKEAGKKAQAEPSYELMGEVAHRNITIPTAWNANELVRKGYSEFVKLGASAFRRDTVKAIFLGVRTKLTDQYGNESTERVIKLKMTKREFQKFNWNNLEYRSIYHPMVNSCEIHWIHPALSKNIDANDLYLKPL